MSLVVEYVRCRHDKLSSQDASPVRLGTVLCAPTEFRRSMMTALYETAVEAAVHEGAIASLIEETELPAEVVRRVYEHELIRLKPDARVKEYLLLFAVRKTREALRATRV